MHPRLLLFFITEDDHRSFLVKNRSLIETLGLQQQQQR